MRVRKKIERKNRGKNPAAFFRAMILSFLRLFRSFWANFLKAFLSNKRLKIKPKNWEKF